MNGELVDYSTNPRYHSLTHSLTHSHTYSLTDPLTHSLIHSLTDLCYQLRTRRRRKRMRIRKMTERGQAREPRARGPRARDPQPTLTSRSELCCVYNLLRSFRVCRLILPGREQAVVVRARPRMTPWSREAEERERERKKLQREVICVGIILILYHTLKISASCEPFCEDLDVP